MAPPHDPEATRARILDAAEAAFAEAGFPGARVDAIARSAGVNKRMLYHYYGDKARLYSATLERLVRRVFDKMESALSQAELADPVTAVACLAETFFDVARAEPHYVQMFAREAADRWQGLVALQRAEGAHFAADAMQALTARVAPVLRRGVTQGLLRDDLEPTLVSILVVLLCRSFLLMLPQIDAYYPVALQEPEGLAWVKRQIVTLLLEGLRARPPVLLADPIAPSELQGAAPTRAPSAAGDANGAETPG